MGKLSRNDLLESYIGKRHTWRRLHHRSMSQAELTHALGNNINQDLLIWNHLSCFLEELSGHMAQRNDGTQCLRREFKDCSRAAGNGGRNNLRAKHGEK